MATITTNVLTLAAKQLLIGATLHTDLYGDIVVVDFEIDADTGKFLIQAADTNLYPVNGKEMGTITAVGATKPTGNRKKVTKLN